MKNITPERLALKFENSVKMKPYKHLVTESVRKELVELFGQVSLLDMDHNDRTRVINFIRYGLTNYYERFIKAASAASTTGLEKLVALYGEDEGRRRYSTLAEKMRQPRGLSELELFIKRNDNLLQGLLLSVEQRAELEETLDALKELGLDKYTWDRTICEFIRWSLTGWVERIKKLKDTPSGYLESFILRYGLEEGTRRYHETNRKKRSGFPSTAEYWRSKGLVEDTEIIDAIKQHQKMASERCAEGRRGNSSVTCRSADYWVARGYSIDEAKEKVRQIQGNGSKENFIKRYGEEEGVFRWQERQERWLATLNAKPDSEKLEIQHKKYTRRGCASRESLEIFSPLRTHCEKLGLSVYLGDGEGTEYFIRDGLNFLLYDFCVPEIKLIIEYHGEAWHPNPNRLTESEWNEWKSPFEKSANEQHQYDLYKWKAAEDNGFKYLVVWSSSTNTDKIVELEQIITDRLDEFLRFRNAA